VLIRSLHAGLLASVLLASAPDPHAFAAERRRVRAFPPGLFECVTHGDIDKLKGFLDDDPTLLTALLSIAPAKDGGSAMTLLHDAARWGQLNLIEELLRRGADINSRLPGHEESGQFGMTPLHVAASNGRSHVIPLLLQHGAEINAKDSEGGTPLHGALRANYRRAARILATRGADQDIFSAAGLGNLTLLERLLAEDPGLANARTGGGETPLHFAACNGEIAAAKVLMERGAAIDAMENPTWGATGNTPLHDACHFGQRAMCEFLLDRGADLEKEGGAWTPLHWAIVGGRLEVVELLIDRGADIHRRDRLDTSTPLHIAALDGLVDIADLLLQHGAHINCPGGDSPYGPHWRETPSPTPLDKAVAAWKPDMVRFLLARGGRLRRESPENLERVLGSRQSAKTP
jgi:ankyrin repeat protein